MKRLVLFVRIITPGPGQTAVPPTVMTHLGGIDPAWGWESAPFAL